MCASIASALCNSLWKCNFSREKRYFYYIVALYITHRKTLLYHRVSVEQIRIWRRLPRHTITVINKCKTNNYPSSLLFVAFDYCGLLFTSYAWPLIFLNSILQNIKIHPHNFNDRVQPVSFDFVKELCDAVAGASYIAIILRFHMEEVVPRTQK